MANTTNRFDPFEERENIKEYFEWLEMFLTAQGVQRGKKVAYRYWVESICGAKEFVGTGSTKRQHTCEH